MKTSLKKFKEYCRHDIEVAKKDLLHMRNKKWTAHGRHSRYPECCITWFCTRWASATRASNERYTRLLHRLNDKEIYLYQPGYIPCPSCVRARRLVYMHHCDETCLRRPL